MRRGGGTKHYPAFILRPGLLVFVWPLDTTAPPTNQPAAVVVGTGVRVFIWGNGEGAEGGNRGGIGVAISSRVSGL